MNKITIILLCIASFFGLTNSKTYSNELDLMNELYSSHQYFELKNKLEVIENSKNKDSDILFYKAVVNNVFNKLSESNFFIDKYLLVKNNRYEKEAYKILADNYFRMYKYNSSFETYKKLLSKFNDKLSESEKKNYENNSILSESLKNIPEQVVNIKGETKLKLIRNAKLGVSELFVEINNEKENFIFDTGAGLSAITESTAKKLGLSIIDSSIKAGTASGNTVKTKIATIKELKLGNLVINNPIFLVLPDSSLYIKPLDYQVKGIIGFPIISEMKKIIIDNKNNELIISDSSSINSNKNFYIENLKMFLSLKYQENPYIMFFDSGSPSTNFSHLFYKKNKKAIEKICIDSHINIAGAGGSKKNIETCTLKDIELEIGMKKAKLENLNVLKKDVVNMVADGVIGLDLVNKYDRYEIDFENMNFTFK